MTFIFRQHLRTENLRFAMEEQKVQSHGEPIPYERQEDPDAPVVHRETQFIYLL